MRLELTQGQWAEVDDEDRWVARYSWRARPRYQKSGGFYAITTIDKKTVYLHRLVMKAGAGDIVDHLDGDGLNCRRSNMRLTDLSGNSANREFKKSNNAYRGVYYRKSKDCYEVQIGGKKARVKGGYFKSAEDAARRYDELARLRYGQFARLNFPQ